MNVSVNLTVPTFASFGSFTQEHFGVVASSVIGVAAGVIFVHGRDGGTELAAGASKVFGGCRGAMAKVNNTHAIGLMLSLILAGVVAEVSQRVSGPAATFHPAFKATALTLLVCGLVKEVASLVDAAIGFRTRTSRLGFRDTQLLAMREYPSVMLYEVTRIMCLIYFVLIFFYGIIFSGQVLCFHEDPVLHRPIATMRYIEWSVTVPCLMWIVGRVMLKRDIDQVLTPTLQTLSYIWLAWAGQVVEHHWLRALLISSCFTIYAESAVRQLRWCDWTKPYETSLVIYQVVMFFAYGIVYLVALADCMTPYTEDILYTVMDLSVKVGHSAVFSAMHRANDLDLFFTSIRSYFDILVGLRALVGAQFDFVINCEITSFGLIITSTSMMLDASIGKPLQGKPLEDICFQDGDRAVLRQRGLGSAVNRIAATSSGAWERQEALTQVADMLRIDVAWTESPTGSAPAELFVAVAAGENQVGDIVLIGLKLLYQDLQDQIDNMQQGQYEVADTISEFDEEGDGADQPNAAPASYASQGANASHTTSMGLGADYQRHMTSSPPQETASPNSSPQKASPKAQADSPERTTSGAGRTSPGRTSPKKLTPKSSPHNSGNAPSPLDAQQKKAEEEAKALQKQKAEAAEALARITELANGAEAANLQDRMVELQQQKEEAAKAMARINDLQVQEDDAKKSMAGFMALQAQKEEATKALALLTEREAQAAEASKAAALAAEASKAAEKTKDKPSPPPTISTRPMLTANSLAERDVELTLEEKNIAPRAMSLGGGRQIRVPSSRHSARSFDARSMMSAPLSPVVEEHEPSASGISESDASSVNKHKNGGTTSSNTTNGTNCSKTTVVSNSNKAGGSTAQQVEQAKMRSQMEQARTEPDSPTSSSNGRDSTMNNASQSATEEAMQEQDRLSLAQFNAQCKQRNSPGKAESEGGHSHATTAKTYRTTLGETRNVQANVMFLANSGKMSALNFTCASACPTYQKHVASEQGTWDWEKLIVNHSEIERMDNLGHGSFAVVTKVKWQDKFYALKCFHTQAWSVRRRGFPYAVRREVSILARLASLGHPYLCTLRGIVMEPKVALLFELCEGDTLWACMRDGAPFSWQQRFTSLKQICEALRHLHENQVVHRDLKNNNVLFLYVVTPQSEPHVKVTDVGLARWVVSDHSVADDEAEGDRHEPVDLSGTMTPLASADWHAPELSTGFYGTSVDIYTFGILFLEVVTWSASLGDNWRNRLAILTGPDQELVMAALASSCISEEAAERPSAVELHQLCSDLKESDAEKFSEIWRNMPTEAAPDKYLHG